MNTDTGTTSGIMRRALPWLLALLCGISAAIWYQLSKPAASTSDRTASGLLTAQHSRLDFSLNSVDGPLSLADSAGKLRVIYLGYMSCPDICPTSLSRLAGALYQLSDAELAGVTPLFISVDVKRDTPENLALYSHYFHPAITGVTGSRQAVDQVVEHLKAYYRIVPLDDSEFGYAVDHSANIYLLDGDGLLLETFPDTLSPTAMAQRIRDNLEQAAAALPDRL